MILLLLAVCCFVGSWWRLRQGRQKLLDQKLGFDYEAIDNLVLFYHVPAKILLGMGIVFIGFAVGTYTGGLVLAFLFGVFLAGVIHPFES